MTKIAGMKIKIIKCSYAGMWYVDKIGQEFDVDHCWDYSYTVKDGDKKRRVVLQSDCEVVTEKMDFRYVMELYTKEDVFNKPSNRRFFDSYPKYRIEGTTVYLLDKQNNEKDFEWKSYHISGRLKDLEEVFLGIVKIEIFKQYK